MRTPAGPVGADERGQAMSTFVAVVTVALLSICGLVVDGGARARGARMAELAAAQAARAVADATAASRIAGVRPDPGSAVAAGRRALAVYPQLTGEVMLVGDAVEVRTTGRVETIFLSLIGIDSFTVSGSATAELTPSR